MTTATKTARKSRANQIQIDPAIMEQDMMAMAREDFQVFTKRMFPEYKPASFHYLIGDELERISWRDNRFLAVIVPPQHGKSNLCSVHFPSWHLGNHPNERFIACSYAGDLASSFSRRSRNLFVDPKWPFPGIRLDQASKSNTQWNIAGYRGGHRAAGVGGGITGMSADILLVDDPVKNQEDADSELNRETNWEWFTTTAWTRIAGNGAVVMIGTRWHEDDLIGRALNMTGVPWKIIHLPAQAFAEDDPQFPGGDVLGRKAGEYLWPERYPPEEYEHRKLVMGTKGWTTLYQGAPYPSEGGTFKREWWQRYRYDALPRMRRIITTVDSAFKDGVQHDYSVFATWGEDFEGNFYCLDIWRNRVEFPELIQAGFGIYVRNAKTYSQRPGYPNTFIAPLYVEDKASGQSAIQVWKRAFRDKEGVRRPGISVIPVKTGNASKTSRAEGVSPLVEARRCFLPESDEADWVETFITEHAAFPSGKHDDMVDTTSLALGVLASGQRTIVKGY